MIIFLGLGISAPCCQCPMFRSSNPFFPGSEKKLLGVVQTGHHWLWHLLCLQSQHWLEGLNVQENGRRDEGIWQIRIGLHVGLLLIILPEKSWGGGGCWREGDSRGESGVGGVGWQTFRQVGVGVDGETSKSSLSYIHHPSWIGGYYYLKDSDTIWGLSLLAPPGALVVIMVYYISAAPTFSNFFKFFRF